MQSQCNACLVQCRPSAMQSQCNAVLVQFSPSAMQSQCNAVLVHQIYLNSLPIKLYPLYRSSKCNTGPLNAVPAQCSPIAMQFQFNAVLVQTVPVQCSPISMQSQCITVLVHCKSQFHVQRRFKLSTEQSIYGQHLCRVYTRLEQHTKQNLLEHRVI